MFTVSLNDNESHGLCILEEQDVWQALCNLRWEGHKQEAPLQRQVDY